MIGYGSDDDIEAVVLAAGQGSRMGRLGEQFAKAMLPVGNEPVIVHHLRLLSALGVRHAWVVVGHRGDALRQTVGDGARFGLRVSYLPQGEPLGSAYALGRVRPHIRGPVLVVLGDYFFVPRSPERMLQRLKEGSSAIAYTREPRVDLLRAACALELDDSGRVAAITEKPVMPRGNFKGCGFYALQPSFFDALARTPRTALRNEYELTVALELHISAGHALFAEPVVARDANLTHPDDVLTCNLEWLAASGRTSLIADDARLDAGISLDGALVGGGAHVEGVRGLHDVVVFPGVHFRGSGNVRRSLLTSAGAFHCSGETGAP